MTSLLLKNAFVTDCLTYQSHRSIACRFLLCKHFMLFVFFDQVGLSKLKTEFFLLQGNKVNEFLQRIITNNVNALNKNDPLYSLILTVRGKFLADFFLYQYDKDCVMLEVDKLYSDLIKKSISFYDLHGCFDNNRFSNFQKFLMRSLYRSYLR